VVRGRKRGSDHLDGAGEPLLFEGGPSGATGGTEPIELELIAGGDKARLALNPTLQGLHFGRFDLGHPTALHADEVIMVGLAREAVLVALEPLAKVVLLDEPASHQKVQGAVNGGLSDPLSGIAEKGFQIVHREVGIGGKDGVGHRFPLGGHGEPLLAEVAAEKANKGVKRGHGALTLRVLEVFPQGVDAVGVSAYKEIMGDSGPFIHPPGHTLHDPRESVYRGLPLFLEVGLKRYPLPGLGGPPGQRDQNATGAGVVGI